MAGGYSVTISATDNATKTIDAVNKRLQAMRAPVEKLSGSLQRFSRLSGLTDLRNGMGALSHNAMDAFRSLGQIVAPLGVITGAASLAGMYRLTMAWANWGLHLDLTARRIGAAAPRLAELEGVARRSGSSTEAMDAGLKGLRSTLYAVAHNFGSPDQMQAMKKLGLGMDFVKGGVKDVTTAFPVLAASLRQIKDPELRAIAGTALLGGAYEELAPTINLTTEEFEESLRTVRAHGQVSAEAIAKARGLQAAQVDLEDAVTGVRNAVSEVAAGPLTELLNKMGKWIDLNREWLRQRVGYYVGEFVTWLDKINWSHVEAGARGFAGGVVAVATAVKDVIAWMDKWGLAVPALGAIVTLHLLGPLASVVRVLGLLGAFSPPGWLLAVLGVSGAAAGAMNMPIPDDQGRVIGNSGGADGERNNAMSLIHGPRGTGPEDDPQSLSYRTLQDRFVPLGTRIMQGIFGAAGGGSGSTPALPQGEQEARTRQANAYLLAHGETRASAAGILAGVLSEGGLNPRTVGDNGQAYGIGQWHADRQAHFAEIFGHDIRTSTLEEQLAFKQRELSGTGGDAQSKIAGDIMRAPGTSAGQAGAADSLYAERPGDAAGEARRRRALAELLYQRLETPRAPSTVRLTPPGPAPLAAPIAPPVAAGAPLVLNGAAGPSGQATITIRHENAPPTVRLSAQASGDVFSGPPRIENATRNMVRDGM